MVDMSDPQKRRLAIIVARLMAAIDHPCDGATEPCGQIHRTRNELKLFIVNDWEETADLSEADLGSLFFEAIMCTCRVKVSTLAGHEVNCDMWDSKESPDEEARKNAQRENFHARFGESDSDGGVEPDSFVEPGSDGRDSDYD